MSSSSVNDVGAAHSAGGRPEPPTSPAAACAAAAASHTGASAMQHWPMTGAAPMSTVAASAGTLWTDTTRWDARSRLGSHTNGHSAGSAGSSSGHSKLTVFTPPVVSGAPALAGAVTMRGSARMLDRTARTMAAGAASAAMRTTRTLDGTSTGTPSRGASVSA